MIETLVLLGKIIILSFALTYGMYYIGSAIDFMLHKYMERKRNDL